MYFILLCKYFLKYFNFLLFLFAFYILFSLLCCIEMELKEIQFMSKMTMDGLRQFPKEKQDIQEDLLSALDAIRNDEGHLGDVVSGIRSLQTLLDHRASVLWEILQKQKSTT